MKKQISLFLKHYWILICVVILTCCLLTMSANAAYTKTNKAKRVAATYDDVGARFSSNYMDEQISLSSLDISRKPIYITSDYAAANRSVNVTICNYARGVQSYPYDRQIKYILTAKPVYIDENGVIFDAATTDMVNTVDSNEIVKSISVSINGTSSTFDNNDVTSLSYRGRLDRGGATNDDCTISFNQAFIDEAKSNTVNGRKIYLYLTAEPDGEEYSDLNTLSCLMYVALDETVERGHWQGNFSDIGSSVAASSATGFDGYNFVIEGVGTGTGYLQWDPNYLVLNEDSKRILGITASSPTSIENGWVQYSIELDSNETGRYDIQFYQVYTADRTAYSTWGTITNKATFVPPES